MLSDLGGNKISYLILSYSHLVEFSDYGTSKEVKNLPPIVAWKAFISKGSFSFSILNRILGWIGFLDFLRCVWKVIITMSWSNSGKSDTRVEAFLHLDVVNLVMVYTIWAMQRSPSRLLIVAVCVCKCKVIVGSRA